MVLGTLVGLGNPDLPCHQQLLQALCLLWVPVRRPVPGTLGSLENPTLPSVQQSLGCLSPPSDQEVQVVPCCLGNQTFLGDLVLPSNLEVRKTLSHPADQVNQIGPEVQGIPEDPCSLAVQPDPCYLECPAPLVVLDLLDVLALQSRQGRC